jgi:hypothetical protein
MDHATYLDRYNALTAPALDELALMLARLEGDDAVAAANYLADLRTAQDALWDTYRAQASREVAQ